MFKGCTSLTSITIPNSVTEIGYWAFQGCSALTSVTLSNSVREIKKETFKGCSSLSSVVVPNSVWKIEEEAFSGCSALESVTIPGSVWEIETGAFLGCTSLKTLILEDEDDAPPYELSLGVHTSENIASAHGLFADCPIENLYLGRYIAYNDFRGTSADNPLYHYPWRRAFYEMKTLKKITLGSKITRMDIFWGYLDGSITICSLNPEPPELLSHSDYSTYNEGYSADFSQDQYREAQVFVPAGALAAYKADPDWGSFIRVQEIGMSDISSVQTASELGVKAEDGRIKVENANGRVNLYDISGRLLHSAEPDGGYVEIAVPKRGVYIVEVGKQTVKVAM